MPRIVLAKLNPSTLQVGIKVFCVMLAVVMVLLAAGSPASGQPGQAPLTAPSIRYLHGTTDDDGYFKIPTDGGAFDYALVAVQHQNGDWHTLEQSSRIDNTFWWNEGMVEGSIRSPEFSNREVVVYLYDGDQILPGKTDGGGHFVVSTNDAEFDFALVAIQHKNGNWHTLEHSSTVSNNFWWNRDKKAVQGWIESADFVDREVRVILLSSGVLDGIGVLDGMMTAPIEGSTSNDGHFAIPSYGAELHYALVAVQHKNGDWHTLETSNLSDNNFWWNNDSIQGWIESPDFRKQEFTGLRFAIPRQTCGGDIQYGQSLSQRNNIDWPHCDYSFTGKEGDSVIIRVKVVSGDLKPRIWLYDRNAKVFRKSDGWLDGTVLKRGNGTYGFRITSAVDPRTYGAFTVYLDKIKEVSPEMPPTQPNPVPQRPPTQLNPAPQRPPTHLDPEPRLLSCSAGQPSKCRYGVLLYCNEVCVYSDGSIRDKWKMCGACSPKFPW